MADDPSSGYEAVAREFISVRSRSGRDVVQAWAARLPAGAHVVDVGCGHGKPLGTALVEADLRLWGIDAAPSMIAAYTANVPEARAVCEAAECSDFFGRKFDAAMMVGLIFLLPRDRQEKLIHRLAGALNPGGQLLMSAPWQVGRWRDLLTGQTSHSLGKAAYQRLFVVAGLDPGATYIDRGGTHYYEATRAR